MSIILRESETRKKLASESALLACPSVLYGILSFCVYPSHTVKTMAIFTVNNVSNFFCFFFLIS